MSTKHLLSFFLAALVVTGAVFLFGFQQTGQAATDEDPDVGAGRAAANQSAESATPEIAAGSDETTANKAEPPEKKDKMADSSNSASNQLLLPDGTTVPVLNGAYGAPKLLWPPLCWPWNGG